MTWLYRGAELLDSDIPDKSVGFVYLITQLSTGKRYIGRKLLTKAGSKTVKGVKKKIRKESDWRDYWSSSPVLTALIDQIGTEDFTREILSFCSSKGQVVYAEELALFYLGVLETDGWFNNNIRSRIYRSWVKQEDTKVLRSALERLK